MKKQAREKTEEEKRLQSLKVQRGLTTKPNTTIRSPHALCLTQLQDVVTFFLGSGARKYLLMATILLFEFTTYWDSKRRVL
jgi:hypothetical protein